MMRHLSFSTLALCLLALPACDKAPNPLAPAGTVLTISASPSQIPLNGSGARITVIGVRPDGNPVHPGTQITLTTDLGVLRPLDKSCASNELATIVETDRNGQAVAQLCGDGRTGPATVTATLTNISGGAEGVASATVTVQVGASETSRPSLIVSANPTIVPVEGCSRITFIGRANDGTPIGSGQRIRLTANFGSLICPPVRSGTCPANAPSTSCTEVFTDANGEAEATFRAGTRADPGASVTAILGTGEAVSTTITIRDAPTDFSFQATPRRVTASAGAATITLTVEVVNSQGTPIGGVSVIFSIDGDVGGTFASGSGRRTTSPDGRATDTLTVPQRELEEQAARDGFFNVFAEVIGEGAELPQQSLRINVDP